MWIQEHLGIIIMILLSTIPYKLSHILSGGHFLTVLYTHRLSVVPKILSSTDLLFGSPFLNISLDLSILYCFWSKFSYHFGPILTSRLPEFLISGLALLLSNLAQSFKIPTPPPQVDQ